MTIDVLGENMSPFRSLVCRAAVQANGEVVPRFEQGIIPLSSTFGQQLRSFQEIAVDFDVIVRRFRFVVGWLAVIGRLQNGTVLTAWKVCYSGVPYAFLKSCSRVKFDNYLRCKL